MKRGKGERNKRNNGNIKRDTKGCKEVSIGAKVFVLVFAQLKGAPCLRVCETVGTLEINHANTL